MGGFFGIVSKEPCANALFYGTDYHSHMGNRRAGMATMNEQGIIKRSIHNIENAYFRNKFEDELEEFQGRRGVGIISDKDPQPIVLRSHLGTFAIVTVGKINNLEELGVELLEKGINFSELSTGQINATELVGHMITLGQTFADGIRLVQEKVKGSCSMLILTQDGIIAARDKYGRTPIAIGVKCGKRRVLPFQTEEQAAQSGMEQSSAEQARVEQPSAEQPGVEEVEYIDSLTAVAFASESCSFPNLDFQLAGFLGPGEAVLVQESPRFCSALQAFHEYLEKQEIAAQQSETKDRETSQEDVENTTQAESLKAVQRDRKDAWRDISEFYQILPPREKLQICSFLWVYYGFPTSAYEGINVEEVRFRNGKLVGQKDQIDADAVCSIPDSGTGMAMGYAVGKGVPYRQAVAKYTPTWPRSFTPSDKERRKLVAKMKLLPNADVLRGAKMVCCDDSIVRGTQLKNNVQVLYKNGVKEIHARISCPPIINTCPFLGFTNTRAEMELVTRRIIHKLQGQDQSFDIKAFINEGSEEHKAMIEGIAKEMGFTSLKFSSIQNLVESIGLPKTNLCTYCFDGEGCGQ
ncbi:MAG: amidophosphoribosyltransferase [Bacteroidales bacterium]|jgi:glutamine phosphoribosylpyrophosphate amidotransferase|nr:amidophosphoribosyltransferase [Bacteroidales bacterium]